MGAIVGILGVALLFAVFTLLQRGREDVGTCGNCTCNGGVCERDGHRLEETEPDHATR